MRSQSLLRIIAGLALACADEAVTLTHLTAPLRLFLLGSLQDRPFSYTLRIVLGFVS